MRPDAYFPFDGSAFFQAVAGHPPEVGMAYLHALWHYWHHEKTRGLKDDDDSLRRICVIDRADWARVREVVFDNDRFFIQDLDGIWQQKRAQDEWCEKMKAYESQQARTRAATLARMGKRR